MNHCPYIWRGKTPSTPGASKISGPIDILKDNYNQMNKIEAVCIDKDGNHVNVPFESPSGHVQIAINSEGVILCDVTGNFIDRPIYTIVSYKPS